jgi:hypothetical protein
MTENQKLHGRGQHYEQDTVVGRRSQEGQQQDNMHYDCLAGWLCRANQTKLKPRRGKTHAKLGFSDILEER